MILVPIGTMKKQKTITLMTTLTTNHEKQIRGISNNLSSQKHNTTRQQHIENNIHNKPTPISYWCPGMHLFAILALQVNQSKTYEMQTNKHVKTTQKHI